MITVVNYSTTYYFGHDHLYSPVALYDSSGIAIERMEYDAYGKMTYRLTPDFNHDGYVNMADYVILMQAGQVFDWRCDLNGDGLISVTDDVDSDKTIWIRFFWTWVNQNSGNYSDNPIGFTGQRRDELDWQAQSGTAGAAGLELAYYKNRFYLPELGRFMQRDPLGMVPKGYINHFNPLTQYHKLMNLFEYVQSMPTFFVDTDGLVPMIPGGFPGSPDVDMNSVWGTVESSNDDGLKIPFYPYDGYQYKAIGRQFPKCSPDKYEVMDEIMICERGVFTETGEARTWVDDLAERKRMQHAQIVVARGPFAGLWGFQPDQTYGHNEGSYPEGMFHTMRCYKVYKEKCCNIGIAVILSKLDTNIKQHTFVYDRLFNNCSVWAYETIAKTPCLCTDYIPTDWYTQGENKNTDRELRDTWPTDPKY